jgi:hypothetical protein
MIMDAIGRFRLSDALRTPRRQPGGGRGGKPERAHAMTAKQLREAEQSAGARSAEASNRDRMVDIGRGHQQAGRQGQ